MPGLAPFAGGLGGLIAPPAPPTPPTPSVVSLTATSSIFASAVATRVYQSSTLTGGWTLVDRCYCASYTRRANPGMSQGSLVWDAGRILHAGTMTVASESPLSLEGKYIKIEFDDWWADPPNASPRVWYGIAESSTIKPMGKVDGVSGGRQTVTVYGLERLLERDQITTALVANDYTSPSAALTIGKGLTFNLDDRGEQSTRGNRHADPDVGSTTGYIFSFKERGEDEWDAAQAVRHILNNHAPKPSGVTWSLNLNSASLDWCPKAVPTDRRTPKQVLDDIIARHRGVSYFVEFDGVNTINVKVFSLSDVAIAMPNGTTFAANADQYSLDFEDALDVTDVTVSNVKQNQYHKIVIEGDYRTSTMSVTFDPSDNIMAKDWSTSEADEYMAGASAASWYAGLPDDKAKRKANAKARNNDRLRHVFSAFTLDTNWDLKTLDPNAPTTKTVAFPVVDVHNANPSTFPSNVETWIRGLVFDDKLPLREKYEYQGSKISAGDWASGVTTDDEPPFRQPFGLVQTDVAETGVWELLDDIDGEADTVSKGKRHWRVHIHTAHDRPSLRLTVSGGEPQYIAFDDWDAGTPAIGDDKQEPGLNNGLDYSAFWVTLTVEHQERNRIERWLRMPAAGETERTLIVPMPGCRLDYVVPNTIVGIEEAKPVTSSTGGFVRDDTPKLAAMARAAELWYGGERQTLDITFHQIRDIVGMGWLITDISTTYKLPGINSAVTEITYDFFKQTTSFTTSFAEFDLA